jgi:hypothetical protein
MDKFPPFTVLLGLALTSTGPEGNFKWGWGMGTICEIVMFEDIFIKQKVVLLPGEPQMLRST